MSFILNSIDNFKIAIQGRIVILFGAGKGLDKLSQDSVLSALINKPIVVDNDINKQGKEIELDGLKVIQSPDEIIKKYFGKCVFLITVANYNEVIIQLLDYGVTTDRIFHYPFFCDLPENIEERKKMRIFRPSVDMFKTCCKEAVRKEQIQTEYEAILSQLQKKENYLVHPYLTVLVTSFCTLNCKDCNNIIPYLDKKRHEDINKVIKGIKTIITSSDLCIVMNITGGEPFLHPDLHMLVDYINSEKKILFGEIITNGTLLPKQELINSLKKSKFVVRISEYTKYTKKEQLIQLLNENDIKYSVYEDMKWISSGNIEKRYKSYGQIKYEYLKCWAGNYCRSLWDGKLFGCARAAFLYENKSDESESNYIPIVDDMANSMINFYLKDYLSACDYCDHAADKSPIVEPAIQIKEK